MPPIELLYINFPYMQLPLSTYNFFPESFCRSSNSCIRSPLLTFSLSFSSLTAVLSVTCLCSLSTKLSRSSRIFSSMVFCCSNSSEIRLPCDKENQPLPSGKQTAASRSNAEIRKSVEGCKLHTVWSECTHLAFLLPLSACKIYELIFWLKTTTPESGL